MTLARFRSATDLPLVDDLVAVERPADPMYCLRPAAIEGAARTFVEGFPGEVLYAVKCNPDPRALVAVWAGGVRHYDCASLAEVELVRRVLPAKAAIHYMHPVKARPAIRAAYREHGVRDFSFDSADEMRKILEEAVPVGINERGERDLGLFLRLALPKDRGAVYDLSGKFGAAFDEAVVLLRTARTRAATLGLCFHVGSQCLDPVAYARAVDYAKSVIDVAGVAVDVVDVGGGFPVSYPDVEPPPLGAYFAEIEAAFDRLGLPAARLWAEPGRALVAGGASVVVQVQLRRGNALYVNDGVYGTLSDAGAPAFRFPVRRIRWSDAAEGDAGGEPPLEAFELFGPTCDSADRMRGPFLLPADIGEGDWIEIGQLGAYGACLRTAFNGFDRLHTVEVRDLPMLATPGYGEDGGDADLGFVVDPAAA
ncbi:MAG TPA: type III PLP-dependent enzyme [Stellaceae bacterium]